MGTLRHLAIAGVVATLGTAVHAAPVDLSTWEADNYHGQSGAGNWSVQTGNDSVIQTRNGSPTVFFEKGSSAQGNALKGSIEVKTAGDDDFVGFVLGYNDGEMDATNADFWLIDWKQNNQSPASVGLALSHVTGNTSTNPGNDYWEHVGTVNEVERATNLGSTGWSDNTEYLFELTFTSTLIEVYVNNVLEISHEGTFTDGSFGFYNYSQGNVEYAGITEDVLPPAVPLPAALPLYATALFGFGALAGRRRKKKTK